MKWVTREKARVDRIACPWLITRFIDKEPTFLFVPARDVLAVAKKEDAIPYDCGGDRVSGPCAGRLRQHEEAVPRVRRAL